MGVLIFIVVLIGQLVFQWKLSKSYNKTIGLVLPALNFIFAFAIVINRAAWFNYRETSFQVFATFIWELMIYSIPTGLLILIYFICREKHNKNDEIRKMNIHDL